MPFEFNGAPPALLDNANNSPNAFKPFSQTATPGDSSASAPLFPRITPPPVQTAPLAWPSTHTTPSAIPASFGRTAPFGQATSFSNRPAFGRSTSFRSSFGQPAVLGQHTPTPEIADKATTAEAQGSQLRSTSMTTNQHDALVVEEVTSNDTLARALGRAHKSRLAVIGRSDIAADGVLTDYLAAQSINVPKLLTELRSLDSIAPEAASFTRQLFTQLIRAKDPAALSRSQNDDDEYHDNGASDGAEEANPDNLTIPRYHWRVKALQDRLQAKLIDAKFVNYAEGARVFSNYLLNKFFDGVGEHTLDIIIRKTLACEDDPIGLAAALVNWLSSQVWKLEILYRERPISEEAVAERDRRAKHVQVGKEAHEPRVRFPGFAIIEPYDDEPETVPLNKQWPIMNAMAPSTEKAVVDILKDREWKLTGIDTEPKRHSYKESREREVQQPFRFFDLPAELRNWVYREHLAPFGYICLHRRDYAYPNANQYHGYDHGKIIVESGIDVTILSTCRQMHDEAKTVMYRENTICVPALVTIATAPCIDHFILPHAALPLLSSVTLVADHRLREEIGRLRYERVNWTQLQAMTTLKHLRICMVEREDQKVDNKAKQLLLTEILERVPAGCEVTYGPKEYFESAMVEDVIEESDERKKHRHGNWDYAYEVKGDLLEKLSKEAKCVQGGKSGHKRDYRFPERQITKSLQELIADGEVDPSIVLGGGQ